MKSVLNFVSETTKNIDTLQVSSFAPYIIGLSKWNLQEQIVGMIYQASLKAEKFEHRQKMVKIIDSLLKVDCYRFIIWNVVFDIFVRFFIAAFRQKNFLEIQALKLIRMSWTKYLPANFPQEMKKVILQQTGINIELRQDNQQNQCRKYYRIDPRMINKTGKEDKQNHLREIQLKRQELPTIKRDLYAKLEETTTQQKQVKIQESQGKVFSDTTDSLNDEQIHGYGLKKRILEMDDEQKGMQTLRKLIKCCYIECKQCGQQFMTQQKYTIHLKQHFQTNLKSYNESKLRTKNIQKKYTGKASVSLQKCTLSSVKNNRPFLSSVSQWINDSSQQQKQYDESIEQKEAQQLTQLKVSEYQLQAFEKECALCGKQLELKTTDNDWIVKDAVKMQLNEKYRFMHLCCYKYLKRQKRD